MKQITQNLRNGDLSLQEVPAPGALDGGVLVRNAFSLISAGTERMAMDLARKSLLGKARERPDLVRKLVLKARTEGLAAAIKKANSRLDVPQPLGYSCAGIVLESACPDFVAGDRVACAGNRCAHHAECVAIPQNLCVAVPEGVSLSQAAYVTLGAIALQGVRIADPMLGERFAVIGLGLLGQLAVQLLAANGCRVIGIDLDPSKAALAERLGAERGFTRGRDSVEAGVDAWTRGRGVDGVVVTAASSSNDPIELAGSLCRLKGRVVAVGVTRMDVPRRLYYEKELELRLSRSYGPGRYDPDYEDRGHDYPYAYVRWTERRNMETLLELVAAGRVNVDALTTHTFPIDEAEAAYALVSSGSEPFLGILLQYQDTLSLTRKLDLRLSVGANGSRTNSIPKIQNPNAQRAPEIQNRKVGLAVVGAGNFARGILLPALARIPDIERVGLVTATGISGRSAGERFGFSYCATDFNLLLDDPRVHAVVIATRHSQHAAMTAAALRAGKAVLVEKPLALNAAQLAEVEAARAESGGRYLVGFNRRFAPLSLRARQWFAGRSGPLSLLIRVNAGELPPESWLREAVEGGGRRIGEVCHFLDLVSHLAGAPIAHVCAEGIGEEDVTALARLDDGSVATIQYVTGGAGALGKERIELHGDGKSFIIDDWRVGRSLGPAHGPVWKCRGQQKGHWEELVAFIAAVRDRTPMPVPEEAAVATTLATFAMLESLRRAAWCPVAWPQTAPSHPQLPLLPCPASGEGMGGSGLSSSSNPGRMARANTIAVGQPAHRAEPAPSPLQRGSPRVERGSAPESRVRARGEHEWFH
jgi:polar amino acid transport system substrate-binding protein